MSTSGSEPGRARTYRWVVCLVCIAGSVAAWAQGWIREQYTSDNSLPQNTAGCIGMDPLGYAWLITEGGLVRYDGHTPQRIPLPVPDGGPQRLREIVGLRDGGLAVRDSHSRRFVIRDGHVTTFGPQDIDQNPYPLCRGEVPNLEAYAFTTNRLWHGVRSFYWMEEQVTLITVSEHEWVATSTIGLLHLRDTTVVGVVPPMSSKDRYFGLGGQVFGFDEQNRAFRVDLKRSRNEPIALQGVTPPPGLEPMTFLRPWECTNSRTTCIHVNEQVYTLRRNAAGDTLFADPLGIELPTESDVTSILVDQDRGVALVGTSTAGLFVYRRAPMRTLRSPIANGECNFYSQMPWGPDRVIALSGLYAHVVDLNGLDSIASPISDVNYEGTLCDSHGILWCARDSTVLRYDPHTGLKDSLVLHGLRACSFFQEGDSMWIGTDKGIGYLKHDVFHQTYVIPRTAWGRNTISIRRGPDGVLWYCNCSGVFRLDRNGGNAKPLPGSSGLCVRTLQPIGERMYIGSYGAGPWVFERDSLIRLPTDRSGYLDHVHAFMRDSLGFFWLSTNHGLFRVHQREIDAYLKGTNPLIYYAYYGKPAGIHNTEFNGGCDPPFVRLANGFASFPTLEGLVWFKPEATPDPYPTAPIRIEDVLVNGKPCVDTSTIQLAPDRHELIVRFSLAYWGDPSNAQFVYRLPGVQDDWYPIPADQRELRFQHLPYGDHVLTIRKLGSLGHPGNGSVYLRFRVARPYYLASWFLLLCGCAAALVYVLVLRIYQARLRKQNLLLGRIVRSRTRELQLANDRLQRSVLVKERLVSIISHDIVTPLRFIARVAHRSNRPQPREEITGTLHDIALSSDKLYMNARNLLDWIKHQGGHIELRPLHVAMASLVDDVLGPVRELANSRGSTLVNAVPLDDVLLTDRDLVGIILQNLVNNALAHGQGGRITIRGEQHADAYHLAVADEGPGLPAHTVQAIRLLQQGNAGAHEARQVLGLGYVIITELLQLLGGELSVADNAVRGTRITVIIPPLADVQARA